MAWLAMHAVALLAQPAAPAAPPSAPAAAAAEPAGAVPVEAFFRHPDLAAARLSPSGRRLALTMRVGERLALAVLDLDAGAAAKVAARFADADVGDFHWLGDDRLVLDTIDLQAGLGDQRYQPGLFTVAADGTDLRMLIATESTFLRQASIARQPLDWNHHLLAVPQGGSDEIIVGRRQGNAGHDLVGVVPLRLNVKTLRVRNLAAGTPEGAVDWWLDRQGELRAAARLREGRQSVFWRAPGSDEWRLLATMPDAARPWWPHSVDDDGGLYVTESSGLDGVSVLKRFDFAAGRPAAEALVSTPGFDFSGALLHDLTGPVLGVRALTDAETTVWFDAAARRWQAEVDRRLPGRVNQLNCRRCAGAEPVVLVRSWSDQQPSEYWLYRPGRAQGDWQAIGRARKDIDARGMATLDLHRVRTRDGMDMPVWLTLPPGAKGAGPWPAVVLVHGGPWVRGATWRWDVEAQFLASRGYVVIQPEFRGSTGYGARHFQAGRRQWGRAMQDDLLDALQWAIGRGTVDAKRVCIAGGSYGGYAALMGPIRHPEAYRCAIAWAAVTDPARLMDRWSAWSDMSDEARRYALPELVGDPVKDAAMLTEVSPLAQAARLKVPLLLVHGAQDRRVPIDHGERLRDALKAAGRPPEWVVYADEGHGFLRVGNRVDFGRRLESFLKQHLP
ncbi:prolyl oligopeptidase family serine peptidase [Ideonella sp. A 288]|uniref:S9 family peptidase n=1 Tax=Ideonella sp. A 288 TaxID=1962181 RepID=UPI000B4B5700|nr:prolyl oligopeptidase family serine peptidase [Ideonella sp. A 288]